MTINIFNPRDVPYGPLSNNATHLMVLDGYTWKTVTNYIYSNLLSVSTYITTVRETNVKDVKEVYNSLLKQTINDATTRALDKALNIKFDDVSLTELLLSTGSALIKYESGNSFLGTGLDGKGANEYGKKLMQIRQRLKVTFERKKEEVNRQEFVDNLYNVYKAHSIVRNSIVKGSDLSEYAKLSISDIVEKFGHGQNFPPIETVLQMYERGNINNIAKYVDNPHALIPEIRKGGLRKLRDRLLNKQKEHVLKMYSEYTLKKNIRKYPNLKKNQYEQAVEQQLKKLNSDDMHNMINDVWVLFKNGQLSGTLSDSIDLKINDIKVPTEEEVEKAEEVNITFNHSKNIRKNTAVYKAGSGDPIIIYPFSSNTSNPDYQKFSPVEFYGMMTIDKQKYPSITHYLLATVFSLIPSIGTMNKAYPYILTSTKLQITGPQNFVAPDIITAKYEHIKEKDFTERIKNYTKIALDKKFEDKRLQDILVMTGNDTLVWKDNNDPVLGMDTSDQSGDNFVGKYLMRLRGKYIKEHSQETLHKVTTSDISKILKDDPLIKDWVKKKVSDMCNMIHVAKYHFSTKNGTKLKINVNFAETVLNHIYNPCGVLGSLSGNVKAEVPEYFTQMISTCVGSKQFSENIENVFWVRIVTMIHFLIKYIDGSTVKNIKAVLLNAEASLAMKKRCVYIIDNEEDNCIVSAILNLLINIRKLNKIYSKNHTISKEDVYMATTIILKRPVNENTKPSQNIHRNVKDSQRDNDRGEDKPAYKTDDRGEDKPAYKTDDRGEDKPAYETDDENDEFAYGDGGGEDSDQSFDDSIKDDEEDIWNTTSKFTGNTDDNDDIAVQDAIHDIDPNSDEIELTKHVFNSLNIIKNYNIDRNTKQNRINFFASL
jgi:predicted NAD-dependent protein-ADP-ribosyltransferase YbiA (DUF1768 family)/predicted HicB family RNase H-like nuclease